MFRFSIRELMLVTLVVALGVGWWLDHRHFAGKANYYMEVYRQWREKVEGIDFMLTDLGFVIRQENSTKSYTPPSCLREKVAPATGRFEVPRSEDTPEALYPLSPAFKPDYESDWWQKPSIRFKLTHCHLTCWAAALPVGQVTPVGQSRKSMKYSLRRLMTFSIRDLALVTVIVALAVGWWVDRSKLADQNKLLRQGKRGIYTIDGPPPRWEKALLPNSSAPAPSPPKE